MRHWRSMLLVLSVSFLSGCQIYEPSLPSLNRSSISIFVAKVGDIDAPTGQLKNVVYIRKPPLSLPNSQGMLFVSDSHERYAVGVTVHFGQTAGDFIEVMDGIRPGDHVIVSDMTGMEGFAAADDGVKVVLTED